jgi:hypothetical protein
MSSMNRRNVFLAMLMAPFAALASVRKEAPVIPIEPAVGRGKVVRVLYHPGLLFDKARENIQRSFDEAIDNDKVIILEEGMTYHEFYGEPGPAVIVDGYPSFACSFERDDDGNPNYLTARLHQCDTDGVFTFSPSDVGRDVYVRVVPKRDGTLVINTSVSAVEARWLGNQQLKAKG